MNNELLVSICIPVYNNKDYIEDCIISCLNQTYRNIEIIVSDNCSNDGTLELISKYSNKIKIIKNKNFVSMTCNWNNFRYNINGNYVLFLCSDDILKKTCVETLVNNITIGIDLILFEYNFLKDGVINEKINFYKVSALIPSIEQHKIFIFSNNYPLSTALIKRDALDKVNWFDETLNFCPDWNLWLKLTSINKNNFILYLNEKLAYYRHHSKSETNKCIREKIAICELEKMLFFFIDNLKSTNVEKIILKNKVISCLINLCLKYSKECSLYDKQLENFYLKLMKDYEFIINTKFIEIKKNIAPYDIPYGSVPFFIQDKN